MDFLRTLSRPGQSQHAPWLMPWCHLLGDEALRPPDCSCSGEVASRLNRLHETLTARTCPSARAAMWINASAGGAEWAPTFVTSTESLSALDYEQRVATGYIPTRDCLHDWYNGLVWLMYPRTRRLINTQHLSQAVDFAAGNGRTPQRNALTLFDESGVVLLTTVPELTVCLNEHDWQGLLVDERHLWWSQAMLLTFGHGLLEALHRPYKGLCAKVLSIVLPDLNSIDGFSALDQRIAEQVAKLRSPAALRPLPVMGVPAWFEVNETPSFYDDPAVFRKKPTRRLP